MSARSSGAKLNFYDLHADGAKIQVMADARWGPHARVCDLRSRGGGFLFSTKQCFVGSNVCAHAGNEPNV